MNRAIAFAALTVVFVSAREIERGPLPVPIHTIATQPSADAVQRGRAVYANYGCAMCHGEGGKGGVSNPNAETEGKIPGLTRVAEGYTTDELRQLILRGTPTIGKANRNGASPPYRMPGWRDRMTDAEARDLVQYLFSLLPKNSDEKWQ